MNSLARRGSMPSSLLACRVFLTCACYIFVTSAVTLVTPRPGMGVTQRRTILSRTNEEYILRQLSLATESDSSLVQDGVTLTAWILVSLTNWMDSQKGAKGFP